MPPAMSPATAPARTRLVGAALRTAKMVIAKGTTAMTAPAATAMEIARPTSPPPTGSTFALSMATRSSVFMLGLPCDEGRQCPQPAVDVDLDAGFRDAATHRRLRDASPFELHARDGA